MNRSFYVVLVVVFETALKPNFAKLVARNLAF